MKTTFAVIGIIMVFAIPIGLCSYVAFQEVLFGCLEMLDYKFEAEIIKVSLTILTMGFAVSMASCLINVLEKKTTKRKKPNG